MFLYKIMTFAILESAQGHYVPRMPDDATFIHLAEEADITRIAKKFFPQEVELTVLTIDTEKLAGRLIKEKNPGGSQEYYHLYEAAIPWNAVIAKKTFKNRVS